MNSASRCIAIFFSQRRDSAASLSLNRKFGAGADRSEPLSAGEMEAADNARIHKRLAFNSCNFSVGANGQASIGLEIGEILNRVGVAGI